MTNGISPKVLLPVLTNLIIGGLLILLNEREVGIGLLLAVATNAGLGYAAKPGRITQPPLTIDYDDQGLPVE